MKKVYLALEDGSVFEGLAFGADGEALGEIVFNTSCCGYLETLTDACYAGQILVQTFPLIGNYGIIEDDLSGKCYLNGYVVREWCAAPSNFRCQYDIDSYLKKQNVVGIYGVDTREITRIIREKGVMNAIICNEIPADLDELKAYKIVEPVKTTGAKSLTSYDAKGAAVANVAIIDYGAMHDFINEFTGRNCKVNVFPPSASVAQILETAPDGLFLADGPGDPKDNSECVDKIKELCGMLPILGVGLGHQLLALAQGADTFKLKYGHRGGNQPVRELTGTKTYITTQNHGYCVDPETMPEGAEMIYGNANDCTCEGISYADKKAFSVQFIPEGDGSSFDTSFIYDQFISMMGGKD